MSTNGASGPPIGDLDDTAQIALRVTIEQALDTVALGEFVTHGTVSEGTPVLTLRRIDTQGTRDEADNQGIPVLAFFGPVIGEYQIFSIIDYFDLDPDRITLRTFGYD